MTVSQPARALVAVVSGYQRLSRWLPARCRFAPTCSSYAREALSVHGAARGSWLALRRVGRCHPFHPGGHDPVPPARCSSGTIVSRARTTTTAPGARP